MKKRCLFPIVLASLLLVVAVAFARPDLLIPEDPQTADWVIFAYPPDCEDPLPSEGIGNIVDRGTSLSLIISGDEEPEIYVSGDVLTRIGPYGGQLFFRTKAETATMPVHYDNRTSETLDASDLVFAGGASLEGVIPPGTGSTTLTIHAPRRGAFPMISQQEEPDIVPEAGGDYQYPHGIMTIVRLKTTPYLQVGYNPFGANVPFGSPAGAYPLIRKDLMPYRFLYGPGTHTIELGTLFFTTQHDWPGKNPSAYPYFPWDDPVVRVLEVPQKSKSLMVRVTNWGPGTIDLDLAPLRTGFESFYVKHNRLSCENSNWPNWPWYDVLSYGSYNNNHGNFQDLWPDADLNDPDSVYEWKLIPGMTAMYWGGPLDPILKRNTGDDDDDGYDWPLSRDYAEGAQNSYRLQVGDKTVVFTWTPKPFSIQGLLYPYTGDQSMILRYNRWNPENTYYPENPDQYQGSGLVVQMVDFDLEGLPLDITEADQIDAANASIDWSAENGLFTVNAQVPLKAVPLQIGDEDPDALLLNLFVYATDSLLTDLNGSAWEQIKSAVNSDTPLDQAFLARTKLSYKGTDLVALAGSDRTNFFRVMGDTGRVVTEFFVVVVDGPAPSGESAVQKKNGFFLLYDGVKDDQFDASMVATLTETSSCNAGGSSGGCSAFGLAPFGLLLLIPFFFLRRR